MTKSVMKKLPEVTLAFWIMKIAATTLGETAGDLFAQTLRLGYFLTTIALFAVFVVTLVIQLRSTRYNPFFYWTVILSTSMASTTMSDFMNRDDSTKYLSGGATPLGWGPQGLGLGYPEGAAILISLLLLIFLGWKLSGMTFQITEIVTFRGEALFWSAILVSNTLGTSMGDFLSDSSGLGYLGGAALVTGLLLLLVALMKVPAVPNVLLFWIAFVLTRPLGATAKRPADQAGRQGRARPGYGGFLGGAAGRAVRHDGVRAAEGTAGGGTDPSGGDAAAAAGRAPVTRNPAPEDPGRGFSGAPGRPCTCISPQEAGRLSLDHQRTASGSVSVSGFRPFAV
ncbi:hypothetical protein ACQ4WX_29390 [Streptomyces lasalocidi]